MVLAYTTYNLLQPLLALALPLGLVQAKRRAPGFLAARLGLRLPDLPKGGVWVHALSVGEVLSARPLLRELRRRHPDWPVSLSAATQTGLERAGDLLRDGLAEAVFLNPLDFPWAAGRLLDRLTPRLVVVVETDLWPNLVRACRRRKIPLCLVNFRISRGRDLSHSLLPWFFRAVYGQLSAVALPDGLDLKRWSRLNLNQVPARVTGSLKHDQTPATPPDPAEMGLNPDQPAVVAGSTHAGEEEIVLQAFSRLRARFPDLALILAPRDRPRFDQVAELIERQDFHLARLSQGEKIGPDRPVLLVDVMGRLSALYGLGRAAFVGGSLVDQGGHNPLEPAGLGRPVLFGPHMEDFRAEAVRLLAAGAARRVRNLAELTQGWEAFLSTPDLAERSGRAGRDVFLNLQGAARRISELVDSTLSGAGRP